VAWTTAAPANPEPLVPLVVRMFEALSVTNDGPLAAKRTEPREQFQWDLGHPGVGLVFWLWQCDEKKHRWREGQPQTVQPSSIRVAGLYLLVKSVSNKKRITLLGRERTTVLIKLPDWPV